MYSVHKFGLRKIDGEWKLKIPPCFHFPRPRYAVVESWTDGMKCIADLIGSNPECFNERGL